MISAENDLKNQTKGLCPIVGGRGTVYRIAGLSPLSVPNNCSQKGTGFERQVKTDEKVSGHVLRGSGDQPAGGAVALYRAVAVAVIYPCPPESNVWMSYGQLGGSVLVCVLLLVPFIRVACTRKNQKK